MRRLPTDLSRVPLWLAAVLLVAAAAGAQPQQPVGGFVIDARAAVPMYPDDAGVAAPRETNPDLLPGYGLGFDVGGHVYPLRWKVITFGFGASYHWSRGGKTPDTVEGQTDPSGPTVQARLTAFSPQASFNFGHRLGWSYISGGLGWATFRAWREDLEEDQGESTRTINYGGGARWFTNDRVAFSLDLRFYSMNPTVASPSSPGNPRLTLVVFTAGASFR